ncbi:leukocyte elastase inhibitor-like [Lethenteron reissneri]|uniref:leukocyte elastase inhibitor-like n=1 Tax=Lethenteron reissneri TaxID=7753 RepID=UPI002AB6B05B|nr:leukocyte elastase inhibitor-like [Lethenteron reissneri]
MEKAVAANTEFAIDVFKTLGAREAGGNVFFSPLSISAALSMVLLGARGQTSEQMSKALCFEGVSDVHEAFKSLLDTLKSPGAGCVLRVANRLYGEKSFRFLKGYLKATQKFYDAKLAAVDFTKSFEGVRKKINAWVEKKTEGKIKDLLEKGKLDATTRLVIVNAVYFKGRWTNKFYSQDTTQCNFHLNQRETKPVQMMSQNNTFHYGFVKNMNLNVLELPYVGNALSMIILLPAAIEDETNGLEKLERELNIQNLQAWTSPTTMHSGDVLLHLPRFRLEQSYTLIEPLSSLGMGDLFSPLTADLSGMDGNRDLFVSHVAHRAFVEVNEKGTEAAAATVLVEMLYGMPTPTEPPFTFCADHPFIFLIRDNRNGSVLFLGRYTSP